MNQKDAKEACECYAQIEAHQKQLAAIEKFRTHGSRLTVILAGRYGHSSETQILDYNVRFSEGQLTELALMIAANLEAIHQAKIAKNCRRLAQLGFSAPDEGIRR